MMYLRSYCKWLLFPGLNLHARLRNRLLPGGFGRPSSGETRRVLDAGCGNGMLAYRSQQLGNRVLGVSIKEEVKRNRQLFNGFLRIAEAELEFRDVNLYDIESLGQQFDEIICTEVLEHIKGDQQVCKSFYRILKPGGMLHLCCPNADHPFHKAYPLDQHETGGHVRAGYTIESYRTLLEPIGFQVSAPIGVGGPFRQACNVAITKAQDLGGLVFGVPVFFLLLPFAWLDSSDPLTPFSLCVRATKPVDTALQSQ